MALGNCCYPQAIVRERVFKVPLQNLTRSDRQQQLGIFYFQLHPKAVKTIVKTYAGAYLDISLANGAPFEMILQKKRAGKRITERFDKSIVLHYERTGKE